MKSQHYLFHYLLKSFRSAKIENSRLLCAVSGGIDSMSLLSLLLELKSSLNLKVSVVHVHHNSKEEKQKRFQDKAMNLVQTYCRNENIPFYVSQAKGDISDLSLSSESQMRAYRYEVFSQVLKKSQSDFLVLAHTADDLLETRLIRLIRGTGDQGIMAMSFRKKNLLRPFINVNRSDIQDFAVKNKLQWEEDPSNRLYKDSLRNWIRHKWLKQLEKKRPGSLKTLSRSLEIMSKQAKNQQKRIKNIYQQISYKNSLHRDLLVKLSTPDIGKILAYYMFSQGLKNYSLSHVQELMKRLKSSKKKSTFYLLGKNWEINPQWISIKEKNKS